MLQQSSFGILILLICTIMADANVTAIGGINEVKSRISLGTDVNDFECVREPLYSLLTCCSSSLFISTRNELQLVNATTTIGRVLLYTHSYISSITAESEVLLERCKIYSTSGDSLFNNNRGSIMLHQVNLMNSISSSLVSCSSAREIEILSSRFNDILCDGGQFIHNGDVRREIVRDCLFENITVRVV